MIKIESVTKEKNDQKTKRHAPSFKASSYYGRERKGTGGKD